MTAPHSAPDSRRPPRRSDAHRCTLSPEAFHGALVELAKLWAGVPTRAEDARRYGASEWRYLDRTDRALHDYAVNLAHGFPYRVAIPFIPARVCRACDGCLSGSCARCRGSGVDPIQGHSC